MAQPNHGALLDDSVFVRNLKRAAFKRTVQPIDERVVSMTTVDDYVILGTDKYGCHVYKVGGSEFCCVCRLGEQPTEEKRGDNIRVAGGSTCSEVSASAKYLVYIKEYQGKTSICVHSFENIRQRDMKPTKIQELQQRAPMVVEHDLGLIVVAGSAWKSSWTSDGDDKETQAGDECSVRVLGFNFELRREIVAAEHSVAMLRVQITPQHSMLGVADTRAGLKVFDLRHPTADGYECLYQIPIEEIRNFQLVGSFVGVFHKFEPNVTFWNMREQRTILCINIQDQMKQLAEEFLDEDEEDSGLEENDYVTAVSSIRFGSDYMLVYGTRSGCVFGMSVASRMKVFNIPFPHENQDQQQRKDVLGIGYVADGKLVTCFEGVGLTLLDFSLDDPPDRPPTRGVIK